MTDREKQIKESAMKAFPRLSEARDCYIIGAQWADSHPLRAESGTGDDERDAREFNLNTTYTSYDCDIEAVFLAGRKGFVPVAEVEKWKSEAQKAYERGFKESAQCSEMLVKQERDRMIEFCNHSENIVKNADLGICGGVFSKMSGSNVRKTLIDIITAFRKTIENPAPENP